MRAAVSAALAVAVLSSCASKSSVTTTRQRVRGATPSNAANNRTGGNPDRPIDPIENPQGSSISLRVRSALMPMGSVPYDGFSLPLISRDGRFIATQTGAPPDWAVTLAEPHAKPPVDTTIEVYRLDTREDVAPSERAQPQHAATVKLAAVLGRSVDADGFLIESPREDGSRHIGKVSWETGEVLWLVEGPHVNAFAALAPDGRLAWSRRAIDAEHFDLVVRDAGGGEWSLTGKGGDWVMPVWSTVGDGLFALHHEDRRMRMCYGIPTTAQTYQTSLRDFLLSSSADRYAPWQAFNAQTATDGMTGGSAPEIMIFHPPLSRMVMWQPLQPKDRAVTQLNARSLAALLQAAGAVVIAKRDELLLQSLKQADAHITLVKGMWIPRRTPESAWPYALISTGADGRVGLTAMRFLPFADTPASSTPLPH